MYTRVNDRSADAKKIKIPDNYSGNAFQSQIYYSPPPDIRQNQGGDEIENPRLPEKSNIEESRAEKEAFTETHENKSASSTKPDSLLSSLFPSKSLKNHFPFGHGIGSEEILILGIMSLIFFSDDKEPDGELIMLLALLLFAG